MISFENVSILLVDDDPLSTKIVTSLLAKTGAVVECFNSAIEAIDSLEHKSYSLIISDWFMPEINGEQFLHRCHQIVPNIPIVFLTANTDISNAIGMIQAGAADYLTKPISASELQLKVQRTLERQQNQAIIAQIRHENAVLEIENKQLVHWRQMYAHKESNQVKQIITLLSRTINQSGGHMWLDLLKNSVSETSEGCLIPHEVYKLSIDSASQQRRILELLEFANNIQNITLNNLKTPTQSFVEETIPRFIPNFIAQCQQHNRRLSYHPSPITQSSSLQIDPDLFQQILTELIINAIKYSPPKSQIRIEAFTEQRNNRSVLLVYVRNGVLRPNNSTEAIGVPYELSEQIFDLFYASHAYPAHLEGERWTDGTGLYIVRQLLHRMHAWIEVHNGLDYLISPPEAFVQFSMIIPLEKD